MLVLPFVALWFVLRGDLLYVFPCVILFLCFSVLLVLRLLRLGKRECSICACFDFSVSSSSWGLGRAAFGDCGTPWTFLLPFFDEPLIIQILHKAFGTRKVSLFKKKINIMDLFLNINSAS